MAGGQHAHMIGARALHFPAAVLDAAPEIAAAHYNADLHPQVDAPLKHIAHRVDHIKIQAKFFIARQCLAADFNQHPFINWLHVATLPSLNCLYFT